MIKYRGIRKDNGALVKGYYIGITAEDTHSTHSIISINNAIEYEVIPSTIEVFLCGIWMPLDKIDEIIMLKYSKVCSLSRDENEKLKVASSEIW